MNLKPQNFVLFLMVLADLSRSVSSFDSKCPLLKLVSGRSRYRWRGRSVRFNCMRGFQLVGVKYATCMNGKWDANVPICVKYGCQAPSTTHVNGQFIESYRGAVVKIVCNPGYTLIGSPSVYCNGVRWNETFPVCRVKNTNPALSCNFEEPDLCGWSQDPMHDLDWKRQDGSTPGDVGAGSVFDRTKGENNTGHYMFMESSGLKMENDTARLYSPVYPPEYSNGSCFSFWYHMHGAGTGYLKVFVKPEGVELYNLIPSFWIYGEQGTSWIQSFFPIIPTQFPFQIVVEGMRGPGFAGITAFDDVNLTSIEECKTLEEMISSTEFSSSVNPDDDVVDFLSCRNRCSQEKANATMGGAEDEKCNCYETCDRDGTCCADYFDFCMPFPSTSTTTEQTDMKTSSPISSSLSTAPSSEPEEKLTPSKLTPPTQHFNNESNEIDPEKPFVVITPPRTTPSTTPSTTTQRTTTPPSSSGKNQTEMKTTTKSVQRKFPNGIEKPLPKPTTNRTKVLKIPVIMSSNESGNEKRKPEVSKGMMISSSVSTTTAKAFQSSKPNNIKLTFLEKPSSPNLSNESRFNKARQKEVSGKEPPQAIKIDKNGDKRGGKIQGIVEVGGTAVAILIVVIFGVFWYKRRENRKSERENMVEDSDSIVYEMDSSTLGSESHSLVCIRPGGLQHSQ